MDMPMVLSEIDSRSEEMTQQIDSPNAAAAKVLRRAAQIVRKGWTQGYFAKDRNKNNVSSIDRSAVCWCASGALIKAEREICGTKSIAEKEVAVYCMSLMRKRLRQVLWTCDDSTSRTQAEVVAALESAARELERQEEEQG